MPTRLTIALAFLLTLAPIAARAEDQRLPFLVVLEFHVENNAIPIDSAVTLANLVRSRIVRATGGMLKLISREKVIEILTQAQKSAAQCTTECEIETARTIGADYLLTGSVSALAGKAVLVLDVKKTGDGVTVASTSLRAPPAELADQLDAAVDQLTSEFGAKLHVGTSEPANDEMERADGKLIAGNAFFSSHLYPQAADAYLQSFAARHKPASLFLAARAYEEAKRFAEAIALYEQYLLLADAPAAGKADASERIAGDRTSLKSVPKKAPPAKTTSPAKQPSVPQPVATPPKEPSLPAATEPSAKSGTGGLTERCGLAVRFVAHAGNAPSYVDFGQPFPKQSFSALIPAAVHAELQKKRGDLRLAYQGKQVCVRGKLQMADGKERILVLAEKFIWVQGAARP